MYFFLSVVGLTTNFFQNSQYTLEENKIFFCILSAYRLILTQFRHSSEIHGDSTMDRYYIVDILLLDQRPTFFFGFFSTLKKRTKYFVVFRLHTG